MCYMFKVYLRSWLIKSPVLDIYVNMFLNYNNNRNVNILVEARVYIVTLWRSPSIPL